MISRLLPRVIDLRITGQCNLRCSYCFGPSHKYNHINVGQLINLLNRFPYLGVKNIVLSGGEPLLVDGLDNIVKTAKQLGLGVVISTNGLLLEENFDALLPYVDCIGIPLDGDSPYSHGLMRGGNQEHFYIVLNLIPLIKKKYPNVKIKVGTVVSEVNKKHILGVANILKGEHKPDIWKLYQVVYKNKKLSQNSQKLTDPEFNSVADSAKNLAIKNKIKISFLYRSERDRKYLFLDPHGEAVTIYKGKEIIIGNFFEDIDIVIDKCSKYIDNSVLESNYMNTYQ